MIYGDTDGISCSIKCISQCEQCSVKLICIKEIAASETVDSVFLEDFLSQIY